jgi:hypothetical protein
MEGLFSLVVMKFVHGIECHWKRIACRERSVKSGGKMRNIAGVLPIQQAIDIM